MSQWTFLTFAVAGALAAIHVVADRVADLRASLRGRWLSLAGGVSVAYVFVHVLPELSAGQATLAAAGVLARLEHDVFVVALLGLAAFYGLEQLAARSTEPGEGTTRGLRLDIYLLHVGSFAIYNGLVGYLLVHRETPGRRT